MPTAVLALTLLSLVADDPIFEPGAKLTVVSKAPAGGEGPAWHPKFGVLTSGMDGSVHRLAADGAVSVFRRGAHTNGLLFDAEGRLVSCEPGQRRVTRTGVDGKVTVLTDRFDGKRYNTPNDLTIDATGRIFFSDPRYGDRKGMEIDTEGVYRIDTDGSVKRVLGREVERANGVLASADGKFLYVADNNNDVGGVRKLWRFDLKVGEVDGKSRTLVYDWGKGRGPDGLKEDTKGRLFVAGGLNKPNPPAEPADDIKGGIYVLSPEGKRLAFLAVPTDEVTNCAFGGEDRQTLYITGGGVLYSIRTAAPGRTVLKAG